MKNNIYKIDNSVEKILSGKHTYFLDQMEYKLVISKLKKKNYNVYLPYGESERVILYAESLPEISLFKINCYEKLRHQDIMGSILGLNISPSYIGDIIVDGDDYYFYIISKLDDFIKNNLNAVGNNFVTVEKIDVSYLNNYKRKFEQIQLIVSSIRIDNVISKIINVNRKEILNKIKNKQVLLNYEILTKNEYILKENDIFSIKKYGKYKFIGIVNNTKKNNLVINILKYT